MPPENMHTVCLLGSPRRGGNSDILAERFMKQAHMNGASTEIFTLTDLQYNGCQNLFHCKKDLEYCGQKDDLTAVLDSVARAQVLVLATPVYFTTISGPIKLAFDRFFSFFVPDYPTAQKKSRLTSGRHLVFLQTQGEGKDKYADLMDSFSASFYGLGYDHHHLVRAWSVREAGDVNHHSTFLEKCDTAASNIYRSS